MEEWKTAEMHWYQRLPLLSIPPPYPRRMEKHFYIYETFDMTDHEINNFETLLQGIHQQLEANNYLLTQVCSMLMLSNKLLDRCDEVNDLAYAFDDTAHDKYNNGTIQL
jgi:hypothetical protein